jgi:acyl-CoA thioesterase
MHAGRTWASDTVTARQDGRLLCRSLVLLDSDDQDLMRHEPPMPVDVPDPEDVVAGDGLVYPGAEWRPVPGEALINDVPTAMAWHRFAPAAGGSTAHRAVLAWATCGDVISTGMRPHRSGVDISQAHRTLSTGVIAHTIHFTDDLDVGDWHLVVTRADKAGGGRIFGTGQVFDVRGRLVAAFSQDSMAKRAAQTLDPSSKM